MCVHGWGPPPSCSLCIGVIPRVVAVDRGTGRLTIDGEPVTTRVFQPAPPQARNSKKWRKGQSGRPRASADVDDDDL